MPGSAVPLGRIAACHYAAPLDRLSWCEPGLRRKTGKQLIINKRDGNSGGLHAIRPEHGCHQYGILPVVPNLVFPDLQGWLSPLQAIEKFFLLFTVGASLSPEEIDDGPVV